MIIFEDRAAEIVGILPKISLNSKEYQINFDWGTEDVLAKYLLLNKKLSFPLIWLVEGQDTNNLMEQTVSRKARFVILNESKTPDQFNPYFHQYDYKNVLQPILDNLLIAFEQSGICILTDKDIVTQRIKNYSVRDDKKSLVYVCNAIVLDLQLTFTGNPCINSNIHFNS